MSNSGLLFDGPDAPPPAAFSLRNRRLIDKVRESFGQALEQGRHGMAERLNLCCQAIEQEDLAYLECRRARGMH